MEEPAPQEGAEHPEPDGQGTRPRGLKRTLSVLGIVLLIASAAVGGNFFDLRERLFGSVAPDPRPAAVSRFASEDAKRPSQKTVLRSYPWWQGVETLEGNGAGSSPITIADDAIQWRVTATCTRGHLLVEVSGGGEPLIDADCPGTEEGFAVEAGSTTLDITAEGRWELEVEQQIDVPLLEPPLPEMKAARTVASGSMYGIDRSATGTAQFYRLPGGGHRLRLDDFFVTPNVDLELRLSPLKRPQTTRQYLSGPSTFVAPLPITAGSLNFVVPSSVDPTRYGSLVIWCPPLRTAYAAASLTPRR